MKIKSSILIFLVICSLVFISADCGGKTPTGAGTYLGGTQGVTLAFKASSPVPTLQQKDTVPVKVDLKNLGEFDLQIGEAKAKIFGINLANFGLTSAGNYKGTPGILRGKSEFFTEGGTQTVDFGNLKYSLPISGELEKYTLRAKVCYPYQSKATVNVCMTSANLQDQTTGICSITEEKVAAGDISGAPVQITSITQELRGANQVRFNIKIENKGGGKVFLSGSDCTKLEENIENLDKKDQVVVIVTNPTDIKCGQEDSNKATINLIGNTGTLICYKDVTNPYVEKLNINLDYIYISETSKEVTIYK
ncbi:MAG: hypothetical protein PHD81_02900 [Candidatus Nanoarchaeia archaeon]|nr:hypothetical protein [Candidatus Nanoarchaeia archaeon]MDD5588033.1 hypothetical protein [Candidatus Nanoarchaeia archaeon]